MPAQPSQNPESPPDQVNKLVAELALRHGFASSGSVSEALQRSEQTSESIEELLSLDGSLSDQNRQIIHLLLNWHFDHLSGSHAGFADSTDENQGMNSTVAASGDSPKPLVSETRSPRVTFGNYELIEIIGKGGMGVVWKARQTKLGRIVALKMIGFGEFADDGQIQRFHGEAMAAARLDHPGILPVFEVGEVQGRHFFSMAYVNGRSLENLEVPLQPKRAAEIIAAIADAVHYAHEQGIVHRDIKPANVLMDEKEHPRVTDFGLAKHLYGDIDFTADGCIMGTPSYMAPEQAAGKSHEVGPAADVYSMGATLYYLLTGRPPIQAATKIETVKQVVESDPASPRKLNPAIPFDLETICLKCLRKDPASRYDSAADLADDLRRWLDNKPILARRTNFVEKAWLQCKRRPATSASLAALFLLLVFAAAGFAVQQEVNKFNLAANTLANDKTRAASHVDNALSAPAEGLPFAMQLLEPLAEHALPRVREKYASSAPLTETRLRAAITLAHLGEPPVDELVQGIGYTQEDHCQNLCQALRDNPSALNSLQAAISNLTATKNPDWELLSRYAMVSLCLGDTSSAENLTASGPDPTSRYVFINSFSKWQPGEHSLQECLKTIRDPQLRSAILLGLGQSFADNPDRGVGDWEPILVELYCYDADASVHSASRFALEKMGLELPKLEPIFGPQWQLDNVGITMIRIPAGDFVRVAPKAEGNKQTVKISRAFWISAFETTCDQYQEFARENGLPCTGLPTHPVSTASWEDAVKFCNWLSGQDGLEAAYVKEGDEWIWKREANGYRLPTDAEWQLAASAGAATTYAHGNTEALLDTVAVFNNVDVAQVASKLPNLFGTFDMAGNVMEWCYDDFVALSSTAPKVTDPVLASPFPEEINRSSRVLRGGDHSRGSFSLQLNVRLAGRPDNNRCGFRLVRNADPVN